METVNEYPFYNDVLNDPKMIKDCIARHEGALNDLKTFLNPQGIDPSMIEDATIRLKEFWIDLLVIDPRLQLIIKEGNEITYRMDKSLHGTGEIFLGKEIFKDFENHIKDFLKHTFFFYQQTHYIDLFEKVYYINQALFYEELRGLEEGKQDKYLTDAIGYSEAAYRQLLDAVENFDSN